MVGEVWKDIPGYEGRYQASSLGRIRSMPVTLCYQTPVNSKDHRVVWRNHFHKGTILKSYPNKARCGYLQLVLCGKRCRVHELVAQTFIGEKPAGQVVRHLNGNNLDNRAENLAYGTPSENKDDDFKNGIYYNAKITPEDVIAIRARAAKGESYASISQSYPIKPEAVSNIVRRKTWKRVL